MDIKTSEKSIPTGKCRKMSYSTAKIYHHRKFQPIKTHAQTQLSDPTKKSKVLVMLRLGQKWTLLTCRAFQNKQLVRDAANQKFDCGSKFMYQKTWIYSPGLQHSILIAIKDNCLSAMSCLFSGWGILIWFKPLPFETAASSFLLSPWFLTSRNIMINSNSV